MKHTLLILFLGGLIAISWSSCKHEPDYSSLPEVSFKDDIRPIINSNCAYAGCHADPGHQEILLTTYEQVLSVVKPGNAHDSKLYQYITGKEDEIMPPSGIMGDKQLQLILVWIEQGARNN